ncbi:hypothetical protein [Streptomyces gardneri]|uniref:hypothetical protein n=1 Tax=Streptomyces gardneri TaxID=66892 RepID=UPI003686E37E
MTAQPGYTGPAGSVPPMRTLAAYGFPGDRKEFGAELGTVERDAPTRVREITQAYRHRVLLRRDANATAASARTNDDVAAELSRKLNEADAR